MSAGLRFYGAIIVVVIDLKKLRVFEHRDGKKNCRPVQTTENLCYGLAIYLLCVLKALVVRNSTQAATIDVATTVNKTCVFHPACTRAARRLYRDTVFM